MEKAPKMSSLPDTKDAAEIHRPKRHLIEGIMPIRVCIGSIDDFKKSATENVNHKEKITNDFDLKGLKNLDWENGLYGSHEDKDFITHLKPRNFLILSRL